MGEAGHAALPLLLVHLRKSLHLLTLLRHLQGFFSLVPSSSLTETAFLKLNYPSSGPVLFNLSMSPCSAACCRLWTPTHMPAIPGPWCLSLPPLWSSSSSRPMLCLLPEVPSLSILVPQPLQSCPPQVSVSVWTQPFGSTPADGNLSSSESPGHVEPALYFCSHCTIIWVLVLSLLQVVSLSVQGLCLTLKLQHLPQCLAYNRHSIQ